MVGLVVGEGVIRIIFFRKLRTEGDRDLGFFLEVVGDILFRGEVGFDEFLGLVFWVRMVGSRCGGKFGV